MVARKTNSKKNRKTTHSGRGHNGGGNRTKVTPKKKAEFLIQVVETGGNITRAAELVCLSRKTLYDYRAKDKKFAEAWDEAVDKGIDKLEDEAKRRAFEGVLEPVFYKGDETGYVRKYSDILLIFLLKGHREKYRERHEITGAGGKPLISNVHVYLPDNKRQKPSNQKPDKGQG